MINKIVIQYQTHQELTNKNSLTEMNHQLWKMETPNNQTIKGHDVIHGFWLKKIPLHSRKTSTRNKQMPTRSTHT